MVGAHDEGTKGGRLTGFILADTKTPSQKMQTQTQMNKKGKSCRNADELWSILKLGCASQSQFPLGGSLGGGTAGKSE